MGKVMENMCQKSWKMEWSVLTVLGMYVLCVKRENMSKKGESLSDVLRVGCGVVFSFGELGFLFLVFLFLSWRELESLSQWNLYGIGFLPVGARSNRTWAEI